MTLCNEIKYQINCVYRMAHKCEMNFTGIVKDLYNTVDWTCRFKEMYDKESACYMKAINDNVCVEPIVEAMRDLKTTEDVIRSNKEVCNLFYSYSNCMQGIIDKICPSQMSKFFFHNIYGSVRLLSNALCKQLILPANEKDSRPDNFGMLNVYSNVVAIFGSN
ncbi:unnamed protein product [Larinioides sclopetarius]